eukprot:962369-Amphidinium_carterae.1
MDMPEPELFEVYHQKRPLVGTAASRRAIVRWFERQQRERQYMRFNSVLREAAIRVYGTLTPLTIMAAP